MDNADTQYIPRRRLYHYKRGLDFVRLGVVFLVVGLTSLYSLETLADQPHASFVTLLKPAPAQSLPLPAFTVTKSAPRPLIDRQLKENAQELLEAVMGLIASGMSWKSANAAQGAGATNPSSGSQPSASSYYAGRSAGRLHHSHRVVRMRHLLERRGWTVYWHDGVGAECWKAGHRQEYLWLIPGVGHVTLNGTDIPVRFAPFERRHHLYGDAGIVYAADRRID